MHRQSNIVNLLSDLVGCSSNLVGAVQQLASNSNPNRSGLMQNVRLEVIKVVPGEPTHAYLVVPLLRLEPTLSADAAFVV